MKRENTHLKVSLRPSPPFCLVGSRWNSEHQFVSRIELLLNTEERGYSMNFTATCRIQQGMSDFEPLYLCLRRPCKKPPKTSKAEKITTISDTEIKGQYLYLITLIE